jgi:hypothetical protein
MGYSFSLAADARGQRHPFLPGDLPGKNPPSLARKKYFCWVYLGQRGFWPVGPADGVCVRRRLKNFSEFFGLGIEEGIMKNPTFEGLYSGAEIGYHSNIRGQE